MYIYLIDYNYNDWFYIGKTSYSLEKRYRSHYYQKNKSKTLCYKIWNKAISLGNIPIISLLEEGNTDNINELEMIWIEYFRFLGIKLTNLTKGGEGLNGLVFSESHRNNISLNRKEKGLGPNPNISKATKGIPKPKPNGFRIGTRHSPEVIQKISNSNKGKHHDGKRIHQIDKNTGLILNTFNSAI
jgi:hypothetical protein